MDRISVYIRLQVFPIFLPKGLPFCGEDNLVMQNVVRQSRIQGCPTVALMPQRGLKTCDKTKRLITLHKIFSKHDHMSLSDAAPAF